MEEDKLEQAIRAIELGNKSAALPLLAKVLKEDPEKEEAWIWLAVAVDDPARKRECLEKALQINPLNQDALRELQMLDSEEHPVQLGSEPFQFAEEEEFEQAEEPSGEAAFTPETEETAQTEWTAEPELAEQVEPFQEEVLDEPAQSMGGLAPIDASEEEGAAPAFVSTQETSSPTGAVPASSRATRGPTSYVKDTRSDPRSGISRDQRTILIVLVVLALLIVCGSGAYILFNQFL